MNSLAMPPLPPHFHEHSRLSPSRSMSSSGLSKKRKASPSPDRDDEMSTSPSISNARLPTSLTPSSRKRARANLVVGRPLTVERVLETLDKESLTSVLKTLCDRHPTLRDEIVQLSPRPNVQSTLQILRQYHDRMMNAFPLEPNLRSDYCYDRVRPQWNELLDALTDFTPHFLPPHEQQSSTTLEYLNAVTQIIHDLPEWDNPQHNIAKQNAYEEISKAWASVIKEAGKRGGGYQLQFNGWEEKLWAHNEKSGSRLRETYDELLQALGWLRPSNQPTQQQNIRQQLFSNTYGTEQPAMRTGTW